MIPHTKDVGIQVFSGADQSGRSSPEALRDKDVGGGTSQNPLLLERPSRRSLQGYNPSLGVVSPAELERGPVCLGRSATGGFDGDSIQRPAGAEGVDVRTIDWNRWSYVYLFPPQAMMGWALEKIQSYKGKVLLISCLPPSHHLWMILQDRPVQMRPLLDRPHQWTTKGWIQDYGPGSSTWTARVFSRIA